MFRFALRSSRQFCSFAALAVTTAPSSDELQHHLRNIRASVNRVEWLLAPNICPV